MSKSLRTLKVVIPDGNPLNYKQVVGGSDCVMHVLSRSFCISEHLNELKGMQRPALYLLIDEKGKGYIGQTKGFAARVKDHLAKKPWWTRAYVFVSASGLYNTANVEYLEYIAIRAAQESASYDMSDNGQTPTNPTLHEWDRPEFDEVFEQIKFFLLCERCFIFEKVGGGHRKGGEGHSRSGHSSRKCRACAPHLLCKAKRHRGQRLSSPRWYEKFRRVERLIAQCRSHAFLCVGETTRKGARIVRVEEQSVLRTLRRLCLFHLKFGFQCVQWL